MKRIYMILIGFILSTALSAPRSFAVSTSSEGAATRKATTVPEKKVTAEITAEKTAAAAVTDDDIAKKKTASEDALKAYKAAKADERLSKMKMLGDKLIDQRIASLTQFENRQFKKLTDDQITALKTSTEKIITDLKALKAEIDAATTVDACKALIKSIYTDYRVYAVFLPKQNLTRAVEQAEVLLKEMKAIAPRLQKALDAKKATAADVTILTTALNDFNNQLTDGEKQLEAAKLEVAKMVVKDVDASKTAAASAREDLKHLKAAMVAARGDLKTFREELSKTASKSSSTSSSSSGATDASKTETITPTTTTPATSSTRVTE